MRLIASSSVILLVIALGLARPAHADDDATRPGFRAVIDRVDLEPATITGTRLRVYLSALTIGGQLLDLSDPKSIRLFIGGSEKKLPYALGSYGATAADTAIIFVIENAQAFADLQPVILEALDTKLLAELNEGTQIALLPYGEATGNGKLLSVKAARAKIMQIPNDGSVGDPALLDTVEKALAILKRAKAAKTGLESGEDGAIRPLRKMIVIVGDGRDRSGDRERVTRLGRRAAKEGVRIHALAFAPGDMRRPLLLLGELARQSLGTFRWVRGAKLDSWGPVAQQLHDEIVKQNVVTFFLPADDDVANRKLKIVTGGRTEVTSNEVKIPAVLCGGLGCEGGYCASDRCIVAAAPTGRGVFGWLLLLGGIGLGGVVVLGTIGWLMSKRQPSTLPGAPGSIPGTLPIPGALPPGFPPGAKLPKSKPPKQAKPAPVAAASVAAPVGGPVLFVLTGPKAGERIILKHGFMIGKAPDADLVIDDGYASSQHAQISMDQFGNCRLYDRGSTNGTLCNGVRVTEYVLQHGVVIQIGSTQLRFLAQ